MTPRSYFRVPPCEAAFLAEWSDWAQQVARRLELELQYVPPVSPIPARAHAASDREPSASAPRAVRIPCRHSAERRVVHVLAEAAGLFHVRYAEWDRARFEHLFDYQCGCRHCWQEIGEHCHRVAGVCVSTMPLPSTRTTRRHAAEMKARWAGEAGADGNGPPNQQKQDDM